MAIVATNNGSICAFVSQPTHLILGVFRADPDQERKQSDSVQLSTPGV
jgi:hypothetical protein